MQLLFSADGSGYGEALLADKWNFLAFPDFGHDLDAGTVCFAIRIFFKCKTKNFEGITMKKMKKIMICLVSLICVAALFAGCTTNMAFTFNVDNGDKIKVKLDTTDGYKISSSVPFTISKDEQMLIQGTFIQGEAYKSYQSSVEADEKATILDSGTKDGIEYIFWNYNNEEYNYAIMVTGSKTGLLLSSQVSEQSARDCFDRMTITDET